MQIERPGFSAGAQDTVVVIHDYGDYNLASVTTRLKLNDVGGVSETVEKVRVVPDNDGNYRLVLEVPEAEVEKNGPWVVTVLLPPNAAYRGEEPEALQPPARDGGRPALSFTGRADPTIPIIWQILG